MADLEDNSDPVDGELRRAFQSASQTRGNCLEEETLRRLAAAVLPDGESRTAREHITLCAICEMRLMEIEREAKRAPDRASLAARLRAVLRNPVFAYALTAVIAVTALFEWRKAPVVPVALVAPAQAVHPVNLNRERDQGPVAAITGRDEMFVLQFFIPEIAGRRYEATLHSETGAQPDLALALAVSDGNGNFQILCRRSHFAKGSYRVVVHESESPETRGPWTFFFEVN